MRFAQWLTFFGMVLGISGCDHTTKVLVSTKLPVGEVVSVISGVLSLEQVRNTDTAFTLLSNLVPAEPRIFLLRIIATLGVMLIIALSILRFRRANRIERIAFACLAGGALGNAVDRWRWGYVVDFIHLPYWPTFNVADMALCIGVGLMLVVARVSPAPARSDRPSG